MRFVILKLFRHHAGNSYVHSDPLLLMERNSFYRGNVSKLDIPFLSLLFFHGHHYCSCSQVFQLPQGHMLSYLGLVPESSILDVPNAVLGSIYYSYMLLFSSTFPREITYFMTLVAFSSSVFLAYQLTFVVKELCVLCWATHVINTSLAWNLFGTAHAVGTKTKNT